MTPSISDPTRPSSRYLLLDVMRAFAVLMMIQGHTIDALLSSSYYDNDSVLFNIWLFNRGLTAPIFLFGSGFAYVIANSRKMIGGSLPVPVLLKRLRWIGVLFLIGASMHLPAGSLLGLGSITTEQWNNFFAVDVLRLMAVSLAMLITVVLLSGTRRRFIGISLAAGTVIALAAPHVYAVDWTTMLPQFFAAYLSTGTGSYFPIFPFTAYMFFGAAGGALLLEWQQHGRDVRLPARFLIAAATLMLIAFVPRFVPGLHLAWSGGAASPWLTFSRLAWVLLLWGVIGTALRHVRSLPRVIPVTGQHTMFIYVSHVMVLYGSPWFRGLHAAFGKQLLFPPVLVIIALLLLTCVGAAYALHVVREEKAQVYRYVPYTTAALMTLGLLFA